MGYLNNLTLSSSRLKRLRLRLAEYNFEIQYKKGKLNTNADKLSRINRTNDQKTTNNEEMIEYLLEISNNEFDDKIMYHESNIFLEKIRPIVICISDKPKGYKANSLIKFLGEDVIYKLKKHNKKVGQCMKINSDGPIIICLVVRYSQNKPTCINFENFLNNLANFCLKRQIKELSYRKMMSSLEWDRVIVFIN